MPITAATAMTTDLSAPQALTLAAWLSPAFPVGAFSYSHGLETGVERGLVNDEDGLRRWLGDLLAFGSARNEAILFREAWRSAPRPGRFLGTARLAASLRAGAELALESEAQGEAFLRTVAAAWPHTLLEERWSDLRRNAIPPVLPVAVGLCCRCRGLPEDGALTLYLHAFMANLISAGVRLIPLGQTAGQRVTAALEADILALTAASAPLGLDDLGSAALTAELCTLQHETQYTRLFRS